VLFVSEAEVWLCRRIARKMGKLSRRRRKKGQRVVWASGAGEKVFSNDYVILFSLDELCIFLTSYSHSSCVCT
jgi:hypothetical protein